VPPPFGLGPWVGARVVSPRSPILIWLDLSSRRLLFFPGGADFASCFDLWGGRRPHQRSDVFVFSAFHNNSIISLVLMLLNEFGVISSRNGPTGPAALGSLRRWINLIYAGWLPHDFDPSGATSLSARASGRERPGPRIGTRIPPTVHPVRRAPSARSRSHL
jgi:hypothetical protein